MTFTVDCNLPDVSTRCWVTKRPISLSINSETPPTLSRTSFFPINFIHQSLTPPCQPDSSLTILVTVLSAMAQCLQPNRAENCTQWQGACDHGNTSLLLSLSFSLSPSHLGQLEIQSPMFLVVMFLTTVSFYEFFFLHAYLLIFFFTALYFFHKAFFLFLIFFSLPLS